MRITIPILLVLFTTACVSKSQFEALSSELSDARGQISDLESDLADTSTQLAEATSETANLQTELAESHEAYDALSAEHEELQADLEDAEEVLQDARADVNRLSTELDQYVCESQISDMKYSSILDASTIMAAWWARQDGTLRVQGTYRDTIWSNADTKIHAVRYVAAEDNQPYVEHFLIYFSEFGMSPGVFWVKGQCWLDR